MSEPSSPATPRPAAHHTAWWIAGLAALGLLATVAAFLVRGRAAAPRGGAASQPAMAPRAALVPDFKVQLSTVRPALLYRIVSFHRGRADKNLIKLAAQLGFNGVMFQIEGSNEDGIKDFADRDAKEHLIDYCHSLGMEVSVWVHELSDLPGPWMPEYLGPVAPANGRLWDTIDERYEWILGQAIPNVDGLVLTVVETQVRATEAPVMLKVADRINRKCQKYGKKLIVRTFVWHPEELDGVMAAVAQLPPDAVVMSKCVPQDWQMRGADAKELGAIGGRPQIEEFDVAGEYFLRDHVANGMVDLLKRQFDYGVSKGIQGICVRVDRWDANVLFVPQEVNLWALGLLAGGAADSADEIWRRWATYRYGPAAAEGVIRALRPTQEVVAEMLSVGPFTFGDTRAFPPRPDEDILGQNWQNWRWDASYLPALRRAETGDATFIRQVERDKAKAMELADGCLAALEQVRGQLPPVEYVILRTKLLTNKYQLAFRTPMILAALRYHALRHARGMPQRRALRDAIRQDLAQLRAVAAPRYARPEMVEYLGKRWWLGVPEDQRREEIFHWAYDAENLLGGRKRTAENPSAAPSKGKPKDKAAKPRPARR